MMICRTRTAGRARRAFTLPELLVVVTITLVLMSILVTASGIITNTVSSAKAQGDFVSQERMALALLKRDLQRAHFLEEDGKPNLGRNLSDQYLNNLFVNTMTNKLEGYTPPRSGYFYASSNPIDGVTEDTPQPDGEGIPSTRSGSHALQFTIIVKGGSPDNTLTADVPYQKSNTITGTCAEITYFLEPNAIITSSGAQTYRLIRRQRLAARNQDDAPAYAQMLNGFNPVLDPSDPVEVMTTVGSSPNFKLLDLHELTIRANRLTRAAILPSGKRYGEDVIHHSVTSFELKFTGPKVASVPWVGGATTEWPRPFASGGTVVNPDYPYDNLPYDGSYDTFHQTKGAGPNPPDWDAPTNLATPSDVTAPLKPLRITGVQIRLRCWNQINKTSRQSTIAVDL